MANTVTGGRTGYAQQRNAGTLPKPAPYKQAPPLPGPGGRTGNAMKNAAARAKASDPDPKPGAVKHLNQSSKATSAASASRGGRGGGPRGGPLNGGGKTTAPRTTAPKPGLKPGPSKTPSKPNKIQFKPGAFKGLGLSKAEKKADKAAVRTARRQGTSVRAAIKKTGATMSKVKVRGGSKAAK